MTNHKKNQPQTPAINLKLKVMKKIIVIAMAAVSIAACNNTEQETATTERTDTTSTTTTTAPTETTSSTSSTSSTSTYTTADGDVTYRDKKVRIRKNGEWVDTDDDVKLDNGIVVYRNGRVRKDGKEIELEDGEVVNRTGNFFDKSGRAIENAWDATKEGAKDAGRAIKNTAEKVGDKVESVVDKNDKDDKKNNIDN